MVVGAQVRVNQLLPEEAVSGVQDATKTFVVVTVLQLVCMKLGAPLLPLTQVAAATKTTLGEPAAGWQVVVVKLLLSCALAGVQLATNVGPVVTVLQVKP